MKAVLTQFIFESNTFNLEEGELDLFTDRGTWLVEEAAVLKWVSEVDSQLSGSLEELEAAGWCVHPVFVAMCGTPAGRLSRKCFETIRTSLLNVLRASLPADAILLHLHGAACAVGEDDIEGCLLEMVRTELQFSGHLAVSLDLHANVTRRMAKHVDTLTAYRTFPHTDFRETGRRAARQVLEFKPTVRTLVKIAALIPPTDTNDKSGRFAEMLRLARAFEKQSGIYDVSLFPVQPWLDVAEMGTSIVVTSSSEAASHIQIKKMAEAWYEQRLNWETGARSWDEIRTALGTVLQKPWILVDTSDATTGGARGDSAEAILQLWHLQDEFPKQVLLCVVDSPACEAAFRGKQEFRLGSQRFLMKGEVLFTGEGHYRARGKAYTGQEFSMGRAAVIKAGQLRIVVSTCGALCADPAFYECVGLAPEKSLAVQVKSIMGWRPGYEANAERGLSFNGPGCTSPDFSLLPFSGARRDIFPLSKNPLNPISLWQST